MNEFIEKLIGRLEEELPLYVGKAKEIVKKLAKEYKDKVMINRQYCWQTCGATEHCKECSRLCNGSIDYYENYDFMAEENNGGWIPCSERLPEEVCKHYLITYREYVGGLKIDYVKINYLSILPNNEKIWLIEEEKNNTFVLAWQPLPKKYHPKGE